MMTCYVNKLNEFQNHQDDICDLFNLTLTKKEAQDDINKIFRNAIVLFSFVVSVVCDIELLRHL